jgi:S-DNA-T family DNA segregation ATPase FtsK/SpoIIIE
MVRLREILASDVFADRSLALPVALGQTIEGKPHVTDLTRTPHLLIAGATGAGKSVCINAIIASLLYQASPRDLRLMMVDPKMLELSVYNGIPHLITPVITNPKEVAKALHWAVAEMEERYRTLAKLGVRSIAAYNRRVREITEERERAEEEQGDTLLPGEEEIYVADASDPEEEPEAEDDTPQTLPYMVIIVDELADLMLTVANEIEEPIARLAQMARAVGIHLVLATQRPSVNVITGVIKANFPSRIAFQVASKIDSRTILDQNGAEKLLGRGDMLFLAAGAAAPTRVHGAFLSDHEVKRLVDYIAAQGIQADRIDFRESSDDPCVLDFERDALYDEALKLTVLHQQGSASLLQRRLKVGYARASRLIDELESGGIVGPFEGSKSREVLVGVDYLEQLGLIRPDETNA